VPRHGARSQHRLGAADLAALPLFVGLRDFVICVTAAWEGLLRVVRPSPRAILTIQA
jgi:hypothetical protein